MFIKRLHASIQFNFKLWKSVIDWIVVVYFIVPASAISYFLIRDFLQSSSSLSLSPTIFTALFFIISFFLVQTSLRLFLYDADVLFYKQLKNKIRTLKLTGYCYSFLFYNTALFLGLLAAMLFIQFPLFKVFMMLNVLSVIHILVNYLFPRWYVQFPLLMATHLVTSLFLFYIPVWSLVILLIFGHIISLKLMLSNRFWATEVKWEYEAFYKWMKLIYQFSQEMRHYLPANEKQPLVLLAKRKTLSKHRLDNLLYKTFLRKFQYISLPLRLIALCIGLLFILPTWAKLIVLGVTIAGLFTALNTILNEIKQASFFQLIAVSDEEWIHAKLRLQNRLVYPIIGLLIILCFVM